MSAGQLLVAIRACLAETLGGERPPRHFLQGNPPPTTLPALLSALVAILLSSCTTSNTFGTETRAVWCEALLETAATASVHDTPETQESVAANGETIDSLCEDHLTQ